MSTPVKARGIAMTSALSGHLDPIEAARGVADRCGEGLGGAPCDLAFLFFSAHHLDSGREIALEVYRRLGPCCLVGLSAETVVGGEVELEGATGVTLLAASLPGVQTKCFRLEDLPMVRVGAASVLDAEAPALARAAGMGPDHRATILLADPFSVPMNTLLPALSKAHRVGVLGQGSGCGGGGGGGGPRASHLRAPIIGGLASAAAKPGGNVLIVNDRITRAGAVGVSLSGPLRVDTVVSQGCRPFGPTMVVTGAKGQIVLTLGGRPALHVLHEAIESLPEADKKLLGRGVFLGRAVNEYKERFGRDDFLIRKVVAVDEGSGYVALEDMVRVGQTVRFHMRDAATASEDLGMLLDGQALHGPPAGALLFTCNGRGTRLFDGPNHDAAAVSRAFRAGVSGEEKAKGGKVIDPGAGGEGPPVPLAGFFAAGEIGPIGSEVFLHGHTACLATFRDP